MNFKDIPAPVDVHAIATLLQNYSPVVVSALRARFPESAGVFEQARILGADVHEMQPRALNDSATEVLLALAREGIATAQRALLQIKTHLVARRRKARRTKLIGGLVGVLSSAGVISALAFAKPYAAMLTSAIALVSSVCVLLGEHWDKPLFGDNTSISGLLSDALTTESQIPEVHLTLETLDPTHTDSVVSVVRRVNAIAAKAREIAVFGDIAVTVAG
jgi:hypothetical protein